MWDQLLEEAFVNSGREKCIIIIITDNFNEKLLPFNYKN